MSQLGAGDNPFYARYYTALEGATIVKFVGMVGEDEYGTTPFPAFLVKFADGDVRQIEISQDEEGNGGGFIFGLDLPVEQWANE